MNDISLFTGFRGLILAAIALLTTVAASEARAQAVTPPTEAESLSTSFRKASKVILPAVVTVRPSGRMIVPEFGGRGLESRNAPFAGSSPNRRRLAPDPAEMETGTGSGVIINAEKGYILTNDHVIDGSSRTVVVLPDGREKPVLKVFRDTRSDLALLVIAPKNLKEAKWGDSDSLETGDWVLAVGQPFGLSGTVTAGIISGKRRGGGLFPYDDLIQTDAAINPGSSGGPLVNLKGEIIGINIAIRTIGGSFEGVGLAIPSARAKHVADELAATGVVKRAYLGISIEAVDAETADKLDQPGAIRVRDVSQRSPAEEAGLKIGELILQVEAKVLEGVGSFQSLIEFATIGKPLRLKVVNSAGESREVTVSPSERLNRSAPRVETRQGVAMEIDIPEVGVTISSPTQELARKFELRTPVIGVIVTAVAPDSPAAKARLEVGTVITHLARRPLTTIAEFQKALEERPKGRELQATVYRAARPPYAILLEMESADEPPKPLDLPSAQPKP